MAFSKHQNLSATRERLECSWGVVLGVMIKFSQVQAATAKREQVAVQQAKTEFFQAAKRAKAELSQIEQALTKLRMATNLLDEAGRAIAFHEGERIVDSLMDISIKASVLEIDLAAAIRRQQAKTEVLAGKRGGTAAQS